MGMADVSQQVRKNQMQAKFDRQKKALQRLVIVTLQRGQHDGLAASEVAILNEALVELGWLPKELMNANPAKHTEIPTEDAAGE